MYALWIENTSESDPHSYEAVINFHLSHVFRTLALRNLMYFPIWPTNHKNIFLYFPTKKIQHTTYNTYNTGIQVPVKNNIIWKP